MKQKNIILLSSAFLIIILVLSSISFAAVADDPVLITTEAALKEALHNAKEGDTILVGDIEFAYSPIGMTLSKGVTIKSGKNAPAVFSGGAFAVMGGASEQDTIDIFFENITFNGVNDVDNIDFTGKQIMSASKIRPAVFFSRCVNAEFYNCDFSGYTMPNGGAVYGIYSSSDSVAYRLSVSFEDCSLNANAGGYGGAIYLSGSGNIFLNMKNCEMSRNVAGYGGAIWADQSVVELDSCIISDNRFENFYPDTLTKGGGIYVNCGTLHMKNCYVTDNKALNGGGIALSYTESVIDGCVISGNTALKNGGGIWNENYGNNLVTVVNSTIANNTAEEGGALYISENEAELGSGGIGKTFLVLTTLSGNSPHIKEYFEERLSMFGCALHGEGQKEAVPSEENNYCYFTEDKHSGDPYNHLAGTKEISGDILKGISGDRFANRYGIFYAGNNAHSDTTYRFLVDGEVRDTFTVGYGEIPSIPEYEKNGYTFSTWQFDDQSSYDYNSVLFVGGGTDSVDLHAVWTPNIYEATFHHGVMEEKVYCTFGSVIPFPKTLDKNGYTFAGWFTLPDGGGEQLSDDSVYDIVGETSYYAYYRASGLNPSIIIAILLTIVISALVAGVIRYFATRKGINDDFLPVNNSPISNEDISTHIPKSEAAPVQKIVKTRYTDEEIEHIINATEETHLLTARELEVFQELLKGKKQGEIAYNLGITVPTVKDNAGRIYSKLGVANKNEMFEVIDSKIKKNN